MMKNILTIITIVLLSSVAFGQSSTKVIRADIAKEKKIYITEELQLSESEAAEFWKVYEVYEKETKILVTKQRQIKRTLKNAEILSEDEQYRLTEKYLTLEKQRAEVQLKYLKLFSSKIGKKKAAAVFKAEDSFKREIFKKLKNLPPPPPNSRD